MKTIDTHSHYNLHQFSEDREEVIARMREAEVGTICVGIDEETSKMAIDIAQGHEDIWAIVGQHPTEWEKEFHTENFKKLAGHEKVVAIGECGLDYFREKEREHIEEQKKMFRQHIELARELDLPLMLHIRPQQGTMDAYEDALDILEEYTKVGPSKGTAHFFVGTKEIADRFLKIGFHISFSGVITFASEYEEVVQFVPLERILSETDAPFAAPAPYRGQRNEPAYVIEVVKKIAEIKGISLEDCQNQLIQNAKDLFNLR
ncbi:MAG TPA: TatD family hydrolase [Candidatus Paceibacterota bacterium]|nr:TatD family hydrolase [Candidatus Paceibacterota bacterium]